MRSLKSHLGLCRLHSSRSTVSLATAFESRPSTSLLVALLPRLSRARPVLRTPSRPWGLRVTDFVSTVSHPVALRSTVRNSPSSIFRPPSSEFVKAGQDLRSDRRLSLPYGCPWRLSAACRIPSARHQHTHSSIKYEPDTIRYDCYRRRTHSCNASHVNVGWRLGSIAVVWLRAYVYQKIQSVREAE
ncbi:hypothetical protein OH76DRAFT_471555 [Lentinus brumalis]|uniref:Uncharacterized protein n=1 Tax=Lentinus brumalis TaxID=2498619 RepID=A0A371DCQ5_9APHY|nr:hypothetical protein OH76DRAFT_471555 [Polyporus brumalis]